MTIAAIAPSELAAILRFLRLRSKSLKRMSARSVSFAEDRTSSSVRAVLICCSTSRIEHLVQARHRHREMTLHRRQPHAGDLCDVLQLLTLDIPQHPDHARLRR